MGEFVEFPSNGKTAQGYLEVPRGGARGPGIVVIQEWWGLVDHIKDVCRRFADEGFVALAPDLYNGRTTKEPDEAGKLLMALSIDEAGREMAGAVDFLLTHEAVEPKAVGTIGFCAGGNLALLLATLRPVQAAVAYYPYPLAKVDLTNLHGPVLAHIAEHDEPASPEGAQELFAPARAAGKSVEMHVYPGTDHAFFNDTRPEVYNPDAAGQSWARTLDFLRRHLS